MAHNEDRIPALRGGFHLHTVKRVNFTDPVAVVENLTRPLDQILEKTAGRPRGPHQVKLRNVTQKRRRRQDERLR